MLTAYKEFWKRYVDFAGRSTRSEYWYAFLVQFLIGVVLTIAGLILFFFMLATMGTTYDYDYYDRMAGILARFFLSFLPIFLITLATFIPQLAITVRRLRDAGYHWAFVFLGYAPLLCLGIPFLNILAMIFSPLLSIALIVLLCQPTKYESGQGNFAPNQGIQPYGQLQPFEQNNQSFNQPSQSFGQAQQPQPFTQENQNVNQAPAYQGQNVEQGQTASQPFPQAQAVEPTPVVHAEPVQSSEPFGQVFTETEETSASVAEPNEAPSTEE